MQNWLERATTLHPSRAALEFSSAAEADSRQLSYAELHSRAQTKAAALRSDAGGVGAVVLHQRSPESFAVDLHAALMAGRAVLPIDPRLSPSEQNFREAYARRELPDGTATIMFTSGTTGSPKPVYLTAANWEANAIGSALALDGDPHERWLCTMPLAHVGGLSILIRSTFYGTTVVLHDGFSSERVLADLMDPDRAISLISLVPTMLSRLLDAGLQNPPTLRWVLLGGGPIAPALLDRAQGAGVPVAWTYGMTETCSQLATFGLPLQGAEIRFEGGSSDTDGQIVVRGPSIAASALDQDGWLRTGDLGHLDEHGRLVIDGRSSDTIISGGENVSPTEVEAALLEHPAVADAGVYGAADPEWGEAVKAKVVLRDSDRASAAELDAFLRERLAAFKIPKEFSFVESLPRTVSGKLLRREL